MTRKVYPNNPKYIKMRRKLDARQLARAVGKPKAARGEYVVRKERRK